MPTIAYQNTEGKRLQGITTLKSQQVGWGKQQLIAWANRIGREEGKTLNEARDTATIPGTIAHFLIECHLKEEQPNLSEYKAEDIKKALVAFENFKIWCKQFKFKPVAIEPNLVSERYQLGGTPDVVGEVLEELAIIDWKTGKIYEDLFLQLGFYKEDWEENHPDMPITGGFHVLRIPKNEDVPSFHHSHWRTLPQEAFEAVRYALGLKQCQEVLKTLL